MADADTDGRDVDAISAAPGGFDEPFERTRQVRETGSSVMARAELEYVSAGCNRSVHAAAWNRERGPGGGLVAYGTHSTVAVYDPAAGGSDAMIRTRDNLVRAGILTATAAAAGGHTYAVNPDYPTIIYRGATEHVNLAAGAARTTKHTENNGHLGPLDDPSMVDRLFGTFAYSPAPNPDHSHGHSHGLPV